MPVGFILLFVTILGLTLLIIALSFKVVESQRSQRVTRVLETVAGGRQALRPAPVLKKTEGASPWRSFPAGAALADKLETRIRQAGLDWTPEGLLGMAAVCGVAGAVLGAMTNLLLLPLLSAAASTCFAAFLPFLVLRRKRSKRLAAFEKQFPEGLDFLARAMRAGHAFSSSLEMLSAEYPAPLGPEFKRVYEEQNLGGAVDVALRNLAARMPLLDVKFFVSAVMLQKDTGGNLGEILRNLANVIRERFRLKGHVKAVSAHGRITAAVLSILPAATALGLVAISPRYLQQFAANLKGKYMLVGAILLQLVGYFIMKRIVRIKI